MELVISGIKVTIVVQLTSCRIHPHAPLCMYRTRTTGRRRGLALPSLTGSLLLVLGGSLLARAQAPANDSCSAATALPVTMSCVVTTASNVSATGSAPGTIPPGRCNGGPPPDVWFTTVVPANGVVIVETSPQPGSSFNDSVLDLYTGTCGALTPVACNDDIGGGNRFSRAQVTGQPAGTTLYVRIRSFGGQGAFGICATTDSTSACQPPVGVTVGNLTDSTAQVTFTPSISAPASYTVTATPATGPAVTTTVTGPPAALTGLMPGTAYSVGVVSNCPAGVTSTAATTSFTTLSPAFPCAAPANVVVSAVTDTSATITFTPAATSTAYILTYQASGGTVRTLTPVPTGSPVVIGGLMPATSYVFTVQALCPAGWSVPFSSVFATSARPVGGDDCISAALLAVSTTCVPTLTSTADATISNVPPPGCAGNMIRDVWFGVMVPPNGILQVTTSYYPGSTVNDTGLALYSGSCSNPQLLGCNDDIGRGNNFSQLRLTGLTPGSIVYARAWRFGGIQGGRFYICATTDASPACAVPAGIVATARTDTSLTIGFSPGATASYYLLSYQLGNGVTHAFSVAGPPYTLTGLLPNADYEVCVTSVCGGNLSTPVCTTLRTAAPVVTGAAEGISAATVELFPNPAGTVLNVRLPGGRRSTPVAAELYNDLGQVMLQQRIRDGEGQIEVSSLPRGLYTLRLLTQAGVVVKRVVVE